jgi:chemosensory pili system protein ChpA (sensor histidine kinase/response regulator)
VKSLGSVLHGHPLFAGVTARGTGQMVLILDVPGLMESRQNRGRQARPAAQAAATKGAPDSGPREEGAPASEPRLRAIAPAPSEQRKLRVMFVDDSLSVRKVAERAFAAMGVEVTTAVDGLDALAKMREATFDLVFTDLEMPRMHGFELIRELRFIKAYQDLPIVVVTSRSGQKHQEQARGLGANEYLTKPFTQQTLAAAIEKWGRTRRESVQ